MTYVSEIKHCSVFRNDEGYLEGYKGIGKVDFTSVGGIQNHKGVERIVTNARTEEEFALFIKGRRKKKDLIREQEEINKQSKLFL